MGQEAGLRQVRFLYCDNGGLIRGKSTHVSSLAGRMACGIGLTVAMQAFSAQDELAPVPGMGPVGEMRLVPDPATFVILPFVPATGAMLVDMRTLDGAPWNACPRSFLKQQVARLEKELQGRLHAAFEAEFSLARRAETGFVPIDDSRCFSTMGMDAAAEVMDAILEALESQGIEVEQYYAELGHGQHELSVRHAEGVACADRQILLRETVRGVAMGKGLVASFAPKPWVDQAGNGAHLHFSLWSPDGSRNLFACVADRYGLSTIAGQFCAGVLDHLPALVALSCASVNSYRRLQPGMWSSAFTCWGPDNREAALRVASPSTPGDAATINIELKPCDATGNPYLILAALIIAGLDGIGRGLELPEPVLVDPGTLTEDERTNRGIRPLPRSLRESLDALEADRCLKEHFPPLLRESYVAVKRLEVQHFAEAGVEDEIAAHFEIY
jgi:glutamine synthetase